MLEAFTFSIYLKLHREKISKVPRTNEFCTKPHEIKLFFLTLGKTFFQFLSLRQRVTDF